MRVLRGQVDEQNIPVHVALLGFVELHHMLELNGGWEMAAWMRASYGAHEAMDARGRQQSC